MEQNIVYDIAELKSRLEGYLDDLRDIRRNEKYASLLGDTIIKAAGKWEDSIRRQKDMPFTMVVCGEFKRGKSSFINALLGEDVVTTDVTTETITLNKLSYGPHSNSIVLDGGKRMLLTDEQLRRDKLQEILRQFGGSAYQLELKRPIELLKQVTIVDTPGLDDSLQDFSPMVMEALLQADAVVYVFSLVYPLSHREQMFLKTTIIPQKHTDLFIVGNYADMLRDEKQMARMQGEVASRLSALLPGKEAFMVSALDERCRQLEEERPCEALTGLLEGNFDALRSQISDLITAKCDMVLPDRMERMLKGMHEELESYLSAMEHGLNISEQALQEEQQAALAESEEMLGKQNTTMEQLAKRIREMSQDTEGWIKELILKMKAEISGIDSFDISDIRKYYPIYCIDTMQDALTICVDYHTDILYDTLDDISMELTKKMSLQFDAGSRQSFRFAMNNKTWTRGDNVALALNFTGLSSTLLGLIGKGIAGSMRDREMNTNVSGMKKDIMEQYAKLEQSVPGAVKRTYEQMEKKILAQLQEYFSDREAALKNQMEQTRTVARRSVEEKKEIRQAIFAVRSILADMK